ncbi:hypothetical protein [Lactobacillus terrae]|uniref:hypothetical protein n=1 Tax=Lactobacillus terrae TaxID=2269374 RepID=UPI000C1B753C|nr:hypothetical protein [Lactobacillus terrae]
MRILEELLLRDLTTSFKNQALAANTAWLTDQQRTESDGSVQYRVATGEWIDAASVTFSDSIATSSSALTDIQDLQGRHVVSISTPGFVYPLFQADGSKAGRALAGGTDWLTDKTAKDAEGHVYYRVSTTEWLMEGTGVSFK